jgi:hypothetical protein
MGILGPWAGAMVAAQQNMQCLMSAESLDRSGHADTTSPSRNRIQSEKSLFCLQGCVPPEPKPAPSFPVLLNPFIYHQAQCHTGC